MSVFTSQQELIERFSLFDDWTDKYRLLIDMGRALPSFPEELKTEENLVAGCQSQVWFAVLLDDGKLQIQATSDAEIVKGLIACIIEVYSNRKPSDILMHDAYFITEMGFYSHLTMTRSKGLTSMLHHVYHIADVAEQCLKS